MTGSSKPYPTRVEVRHNVKKGWIALYQIRAVDKQRIIKILDVLIKEEVAMVKAVIKEAYVD